MKNRKRALVAVSIILALAVIFALAFIWRGREGRRAVDHAPPNITAEHISDRTDLRNAQPLTPSQSLDVLLHALRDWNLGTASQFISPAGVDIFSDSYREALGPLIDRLEFGIRVERITEQAAVVEVAVYAIDFDRALGNMTEHAANYLLHRELDSSQPNWPEFLAEHVARLENPDQLIRVQRTATVHMIQAETGHWVLDGENPENRAFYNAVSGGLLDMIDRLAEVEPEAVDS
ncbi:MAG: hypothetical protein FWE32_02155 [Oscillospiraceae bacterium]|nr:hypothetical protein [Oscillospiraceae bacterium]